MKILITGATGFVGKTLLPMLEEQGMKREDILLVASREVPGYPCVLHKDYTYTTEEVREAAKGEPIDVVIHMGATTPKGKGYISSMEYARNVSTTMHLMEHLPNVPKKVIFGSSTSVYQNVGDGAPISEQTPLNPADPYSVSKILCEQMLTDWCKDQEAVLQILRFGPIYGPGEETYNKLMGTFLKKAMANEEIHIFSDGSETRSMIYVSDVCRMILAAMRLEETEKPINITESRKISLAEIADTICEVTASKTKVCLDHKGVLRSECFDNARMCEVLGNPKVDYKQGIIKLYEHFQRIL